MDLAGLLSHLKSGKEASVSISRHIHLFLEEGVNESTFASGDPGVTNVPTYRHAQIDLFKCCGGRVFQALADL
jgi:hypothetical protein